MERGDLHRWAYTIFIMILTITVGIFGINQFLAYKYKAHFLASPCNLCEELNPHLSPCFTMASTYYIDPEGNRINKTEYEEGVKGEYYNLSNINLSSWVVP